VSNSKRLGRGLQALLGGSYNEPQQEHHEAHVSQFGSIEPSHDDAQYSLAASPQASDVSAASGEHTVAETTGDETGILLLGVNDVYDNPFQPRREFSESEITSLAESLKEHDMLQPILVRKMSGGYQLIAGERRLRAARQAGWTHVPARVKEADDRLVAELAIVENLQRQDLNAIEKAMSFQRYIEQHGCTQDDLAQRIKVDRATIANMMRLLELPEDVKDALTSKKITAGHARALLPLGDEAKQKKFCARIQDEGLSVRAIEQLVREVIEAEDREPFSIVGADGVSRPANPKPPKNAHQLDLEQQLKMSLGTKVEVKQTSKKKGRIVIHFASPEEFERIRGQLSGGPIHNDASIQQ
jgi:ParB family chromosome partitioning protein